MADAQAVVWPQGSRLRIFAGACAIALSLGVVRFDFAALGRQMLESGWVDPQAIGRLAGLNLAGYVLGCLHHTRIRSSAAFRRVMALSLAVTVASLWLEALGLGSWWQGLWRVLAGWASGSLMAGVPGLALHGLSGHRRRRGTALVMVGAGLGTVVGAVAIGSLAPRSASMAWVVLAALASLLAIPVGWLLRRSAGAAASPPSRRSSEAAGLRGDLISAESVWASPALRFLSLGYLLMGASQVPVVLYEPLVVSHRFGVSPGLSSDSLSLLGVGCATGALLAASVPRSWPTRSLLALGSWVGLGGSVLFLLGRSLPVVAAATFLTGAWIWIMVTLTFDRLQELVPEAQHRATWAWLTALLGIGFMLFSFGCAQLATDHLDNVLLLGTAFMALHVVIELRQMQAD
ncbi:YbfB/YjiJ family MFS transporter [Cyanobium sp. LEGE 06143]|uniref:YbfB/YjiJ family MFS transporter n=1 Tax=Cyanobium sp. LEGE 06143 TaxID=945727 RepID=UPI001880238D|nr:YbfB/YjiJ family MFS transporter [Cyanobium sp. LEGE 06143]MBE9173924.1 YbfB/YjiJ family MFS transporter [Cyanobium sp. LEGE 06143]